MRRSKLLLILAVSYLIISTAQATIFVKQDSPGPVFDGKSWQTAYHTIQQGIDTVDISENIWVAAGTYNERIKMKSGVSLYGGFAGNESILESRNWNENVTVLDGNRAGSVVTIQSGQSSSTRIDGFTLCNGSGTQVGTIKCGAGVYCVSGASPTIVNNTFTSNITGYGAGVYCTSSTAVISDNIFSDSFGEYGGGICCDNASPKIFHNTFLRNGACEGGAIYCRQGGSPNILSNVIKENSALEGGGIFCIYAYPFIANNQFVANGAYWGGGIHCWNSSSTKMINNSFLGNQAYQGGAIYTMGCSPKVINNIVAYNSSGIYRDVRVSGTPSVRYNCFYGNYYNYGGMADQTGMNGNISVDPKLADTKYGKPLHVQPGSPCIDTGDDSVLVTTWVDADLQARKVGVHVDMGADESDGTDWQTDSVIVRVSSNGDDANDGSSWLQSKRTIQAAVDAAYVEGGEVWVQAGHYDECLTLRPYTYLYGGFCGNEDSRSQVNRSVCETTIDGQKQNSTITVVQAGYMLACVDGFTIIGGKGLGKDYSNIRAGGGIDCTYSHYKCSYITISNNTITQNEGYGIYFGQASGAIITDNRIVNNNGAGIHFRWTPSIIRNNRVSSNSQEGIYFISCGPVADYYYSKPPIVSGNTVTMNGREGIYGDDSVAEITDNFVGWNEYGGIKCESYFGWPSSNIRSNTVVANKGGGICCYNCITTVTDNLVVENIGDGIACSKLSSQIIGNTVVSNSAGINYADSKSAIGNNIVAFNMKGLTGHSSSMLTTNCVFGNTTDYENTVAGATDIHQDPVFADRQHGNYHIQPDSPCIDAADDSLVLSQKDIDGQSRKQGSHVDIGADESNGTDWPETVPQVIRVKPSGDDANDGSSWDKAKRSVQSAVETAAMTMGEVWVAAGHYRERIKLPAVSLYGGFSGTEETRSERDWARSTTILDGEDKNVAIKILSASSPVIIDGFTITRGKYVWGTSAAAIDSQCPVTIANNLFVANKGGCLIYCRGCSQISNNTIIGNSGGVTCNSQTSICGNTIVANSRSGASPVIDCTDTARIANNIVAFNAAGIRALSGSSVTTTNNCVYENKDYNYSGIDDPTGSDGNISIDPQLANLICGNIHLQPDSLCVDAGNDAYATGDFDSDHQMRMQDDHVDIGADEADGIVWPVGISIFHVSPEGDDNADGLSWASAKKTVQAGVDAASVSGGEVWVARGNYSETITIPNFVYLYGGFAWNESERYQRDWKTNLTVIDGGKKGSVVTMVSGHHLSCIDGFTIRNGSGTLIDNSTCGGGIYCYFSGPVISNNTITENTTNDEDTYYYREGGGIWSWSSAPVITDNIISHNTSDEGAGIFCYWSAPVICGNEITDNQATAYSGGIYSESTMSIDLSRNVVSGNSATEWYGGICVNVREPYVGYSIITDNEISSNTAKNMAGIGCYSDGDPSLPLVMSNNRIFGNTGISGSGAVSVSGSILFAGNTVTENRGTYGGGIFASPGVTVINNLIARNSAEYQGGGVVCSEGPDGYAVSLIHNTIVANSAERGGAISLSGNTTLVNNLIAYNSSGLCVDEVPWATTPSMNCNCVYRNMDYNYQGFDDQTGQNGNISADPCFLNRMLGDYHLLPGSPCMDVAEPDIVYYDLEGNPRPKDGDGDGNLLPDIGCYECPDHYVSLSGAKGLPDGSRVGISGQISTAIFDDRFYAEDQDRTTGIGILGNVASTGKRVYMEGSMTTVDGERLIIPSSVSSNSNANVPSPYLMNLNGLGGGSMGCQGAVQDWRLTAKLNELGEKILVRDVFTCGGANNIGLLVKVAGRVTQADDCFYIDDGSAFDDGDDYLKGVKVDWPFLDPMPQDGSFTEITGISSCTIKNGLLVRMLRPILAQSINKLTD